MHAVASGGHEFVSRFFENLQIVARLFNFPRELLRAGTKESSVDRTVVVLHNGRTTHNLLKPIWKMKWNERNFFLFKHQKLRHFSSAGKYNLKTFYSSLLGRSRRRRQKDFKRIKTPQKKVTTFKSLNGGIQKSS